MKTLVKSVSTLAIFAGTLSAMSAQAIDLEPGSYRGKIARKDRVHMMVREITGRQGSFMAVLYQYIPRQQAACLFMVDPLEPAGSGTYAMIPLSVSTKDGEIVQASDKPSLKLTIRGSRDGSPVFSIGNSGTGNGICGYFGDDLDFEGYESKFKWTSDVLNGQYKIAGLDRKSGEISQSVVVPGDTAQQASVNLHVHARGGAYSDARGSLNMREKAPGFFTLKPVKTTEFGDQEEASSKYIGFYTENRAGKSFINFINPVQHENVWRMKLKTSSNAYVDNSNSSGKSDGKDSYKPVVMDCSAIKSRFNQDMTKVYDKHQSGREGTETYMSPEELKSISTWAYSTRNTLQRALDAFRNENATMVQKKHDLKCAMEVAVQVDSQTMPEEQLVRFYLNRGLEAVEVIDKEAGVLAGFGGPAPGTIDQQARLLNHSIERAIGEIKQRFNCDNNGCKKADLPITNDLLKNYVKFGVSASKFVMGLSNSLYDATAQYELVKRANLWLSQDLKRNTLQGYINLYASTITHIQTTIADKDKYPDTVSSDAEAVFKIRKLKALFKQSLTEIDQEHKDANLEILSGEITGVLSKEEEALKEAAKNKKK